MLQRKKIIRFVLLTGTIAAWFAVVAQLYLIIVNRAASVSETIIRYFSFYTILTNILVAICFTISTTSPLSRWGRFFSRATTVTAIAVYITVVGLVYNFILRALWKPEGTQRLVDELLHSVIPALFIIYWSLFKDKGRLKYKNAFRWLAYPLVYILFVLFRGKLSGYYPYPFINVQNLGYDKVFLNCFFLFLAFLLISFVFIFFGSINKESSR